MSQVLLSLLQKFVQMTQLVHATEAMLRALSLARVSNAATH